MCLIRALGSAIADPMRRDRASELTIRIPGPQIEMKCQFE